MKKIEFRAGYYEWLIIIDDKLIATIGTFESDDEVITKEMVESDIEMQVDDLVYVAKHYDKEEQHYFEDEECANIFSDLSKEELDTLKKLMGVAWSYLYD